MSYTIVTMSRGDQHRIVEWVKYHEGLGFDEFHIVLDHPIDDTEDVLLALDVQATITVEVREPVGEYYDGLSAAQRWERVKAWRLEHEAEIAASGLPINDALAWRQYRHLPQVLAQYQERRSGWLALIDVDEFIVPPPGQGVADLVAGAQHPRVRLLNFNVNTADYDPGRPILEQHSTRWAYEDMLAYGRGWDRRVKSIVRYDALLPLASVHPISKGPFVQLDPSAGRLLHFKTPPMDIIPYTVEDRGAMQHWLAAEDFGASPPR